MNRLVVLAAFAQSACAPTRSLNRRELLGRPEPRATLGDVPLRGVGVEIIDDTGERSGELLAIGPRRIWILQGRHVRGILRSRVSLVRIPLRTHLANDLVARPRHFDLLYQFARFPQGLPAAWRPHDGAVARGSRHSAASRP